VKTPRPVIIMNSVLAGLGVLLGGSALTELVPVQAIGVAALVLAAVQVGWGTYVQGQVTPQELVAARRDTGTGALVAGPAAPGVASRAPGSTNVGDVVDVTKAEADQWPPVA
jgi:hypothetical protein